MSSISPTWVFLYSIWFFRRVERPPPRVSTWLRPCSWARGSPPGASAWKAGPGWGGLLLFTAFFQAAVIAVMDIFLHPWVAALILFRSVPRALMTAPFNAAIATRVPQAQRVTYLSIQSLAGRLVFCAMLFLLSLAGALVLAATVRVLRRGDR